MTSTSEKIRRYADRKSGRRPLVTPPEKACSRCREVKPASEFRRSFHNDTGLESRCHDCVGHVNRERLFGLTQDQYEQMLARQQGLCAICRGSETARANHGRSLRGLAVDHDHETDVVRELLCSNCNKALGCMQDDPDRLLAAAMYLLRHRGQS